MIFIYNLDLISLIKIKCFKSKFYEMSYFFQYYALIIFILFASVLSSILIILSYIFDPQKEVFEKTTSYECGFEPFGDARNVLNIQFYIVAILFIIFDLEVAFLLP